MIGWLPKNKHSFNNNTQPHEPAEGLGCLGWAAGLGQPNAEVLDPGLQAEAGDHRAEAGRAPQPEEGGFCAWGADGGVMGD